MTEPGPTTGIPSGVVEAIARRRTARRIDQNRPLSDGVLTRLLGLATLAPSPFNLQPWRFLVVRSKRNRERLRACAFGRPEVAEAPAVVIVLGYLNGVDTDLGPMLERRQVLGMAPEAAAEARRRATDALSRLEAPSRAAWAIRSAMLAASTLMIAAEGLGIASAWIDGLDAARLKVEFGVPDDHAVACLVALGYAVDREPSPGRFGLVHVCYEEHFGQPWTLGKPAE